MRNRAINTSDKSLSAQSWIQCRNGTKNDRSSSNTLSRHKERSLCHAVFVCSLCICVLCLEAHPFTLATGNERQLKSRARSMAHRDRHTRPISLSSLWPPPSISVSLSPAVSMRHSDVSQVCLQHSGVQASRTSQVRLYQHFFLIYFHTVYILYPPFPKSPFFLRSANPWCLWLWLFICMPVLHQCLRSYEIFCFVFLMRDSSLKQHTSSGPAQRLATCGIIDYRYQQSDRLKSHGWL